MVDEGRVMADDLLSPPSRCRQGAHPLVMVYKGRVMVDEGRVMGDGGDGGIMAMMDDGA